MSGIGAIIAGIAVKVGAPIVTKILTDQFGRGGAIAGDVIDAVAANVGKPADQLDQVPQKQLEEAVMQAEQEHGAEWLDLWSRGLDYQQAIMLAEQKEAPIERAWRWGWMYLLAFLWTWTIVLVPLVNALAGAAIATIELDVLMTLTTWFIALYMGGHTVKDLGKTVSDAMARRAGR